MGWLNSIEKMIDEIPKLIQFKKEIENAGFKHIVLLGMGGSSLAPLLLSECFTSNFYDFTVLDTTDPLTIYELEKKIDLNNTLFIVASKSGNTAEVNALFSYFFSKVSAFKGELAGRNFIAITDADTTLEKLANENHFRRCFLNFKDVGGRYSALTYFGLVPAALLGVDLDEFLNRALRMSRECASSELISNPGIILGAIMGELTLFGKDKLTLILPEELISFGLWIEQLVAESTGKSGKGILPVIETKPSQSLLYAKDRLFVIIKSQVNTKQNYDPIVETLISSGQPVIVFNIDEATDLGKEFFRWEIATAVAGAILQVNPFDQPNVQENKEITHNLLAELEKNGSFPVVSHQEISLSFFTEEETHEPESFFNHILSTLTNNSFIGLQAYLPDNTETRKILEEIRLKIQNHFKVSCTVGIGPRFLHSTGQLHKGGPQNGIFLQFTCNDEIDLPIPGKTYTMGQLKIAQAKGDLYALKNHNRQAGRIHLGKNFVKSLDSFREILETLRVETPKE